jgi:competence protein ComEC
VSVVAQVIVDGEPLLLIPGDLDQIGYEQLSNRADHSQLKTKYLLLPHHGGLIGVPAVQTAATITSLVASVQPEIVFVSNGRGRYANPRREVVAATRAAVPRIPISCTQLAKTCAVRTILQKETEGPYSYGWERGSSCQGSTRLVYGNGIGAPLDRSRHIDFLASMVPARVCAEGPGLVPNEVVSSNMPAV